jgi:hypothetical protein
MGFIIVASHKKSKYFDKVLVGMANHPDCMGGVIIAIKFLCGWFLP